MKTFQKGGVVSLFLFFFICTFLPVKSQSPNWDTQQKDVWKDVVAYNHLFAKGDATGFFNYFDSSYIGWSYRNERPASYDEMQKGVNDFFNSGNKMQISKMTPLAIRVLGNHAFVDYDIDATVTNKDGKTMADNEQWTDILEKKNGKWVLIGDHGGDPKDLKISDSASTDPGTQTWNDEQNEILNTEKAFDEAFSNGEVEKLGSFYAPDYVNFTNTSNKVSSKDQKLENFSTMIKAGDKFNLGQMIPYAVSVNNDFAFVDYLITGSITDSTGVTKTRNVRWTDIFQKKDGNWILVGDHGTFMPANKQS